jgi:hexosaminidase
MHGRCALHDTRTTYLIFAMKLLKTIIWASCLFLVMQCKEKESQTGSLSVIPYPVTLNKGDGTFTISNDTKIVSDPSSALAASFLAELISASSQFTVTPAKESADLNFIEFKTDSSLEPEAYELIVTDKSISIAASNQSGFFYGVQTLRQMLSEKIENRDKSVASWSVPAVTISDKPRYSWRGMHLDVSRHLFSKEFLKSFIDRLALYKFNKFHLHLTDDQGWRVEIKKYPELTTKGAWRLFNDQDLVCIENAKENPDFALPTEFMKDTPEGKVYGGFYTQDDIRELVQYAADRSITIVPEIDMPGHMKAVLNSYPELSCVDGTGWGKIFSIPLCPCEEGTYEFAENILTEIAELFPGEYVHIGGDEVDKTTWAQSDACKALIKKEKLKNVDELQSYFIRRMEKFLLTKNKKMIGWDEVLDGGVDSTTNIMYWRGWVPDAPLKAARNNNDVIMSPTSHCYFDYLPDNTTLEKMYGFNPVPENLSGKDANRIVGVQANIWTEWIPTVSRLDYMTMPRMLALSEVGWAKSTSYNEFNARVSDHYRRMDELKINYRLPDLPQLRENVVFTDKETLTLETPVAVTEIRYTTDGSTPTASSSLYKEPIAIESSTTFKVLTLGVGGRSGNVYTLKYDKQTYSPAVAPTFNGIKCRYFEGNSFSSVKDTIKAKFIKEALVNGITIPSFCREESYALNFTTYIEVPEDGIYTFYQASDDGAVLTVDDRIVIDHDGFKGSNEVRGQIALQKGSHRVHLSYFEAGGGNRVSLEFDGPLTQKRKL